MPPEGRERFGVCRGCKLLVCNELYRDRGLPSVGLQRVFEGSLVAVGLLIKLESSVPLPFCPTSKSLDRQRHQAACISAHASVRFMGAHLFERRMLVNMKQPIRIHDSTLIGCACQPDMLRLPNCQRAVRCCALAGKSASFPLESLNSPSLAIRSLAEFVADVSNCQPQIATDEYL